MTVIPQAFYDEDDTQPSNPQDGVSLPTLTMQRRQFLQGSLGLAAALSLPRLTWAARKATSQPVGVSPFSTFTPIPVSSADQVSVPAGFVAEVLYAWGDPISTGKAAQADASDSAAAQALQAGMHHDGMAFFPFMVEGKPSSTHGLLCINHEYTDDGLLHSDGMQYWSAEKVAKSQAAHGVSVIEVQAVKGHWQVVRPSMFARRITATTPCTVHGAAAGHPLLQTAADSAGKTVLGTLNNCAMGQTPWGTYLTCEENFNTYFACSKPSTAQKRYGLGKGGGKGNGYRWEEFDPRFDLDQHPNEANRFGWVVEIDPWNPAQSPKKRTALGRFKHEGATVTLNPEQRVVVYMGDDEKFEYIYKFVSQHPYQPGKPETTDKLLDEGTLYVAKFHDDGRGTWLPLVHGLPRLRTEDGFGSQAEILIRCREAADAVGATKMDRPEWITVHPHSQEVYVSLSNNNERGSHKTPGLNAANPRARNVFGHIVRWQEAKHDAAATEFTWNIFLAAGDPQHPDPEQRGNIHGDAFGSPDGLWFDAAGNLWIQTDVSTSVLHQGDYANLGNNQLLVADTKTGVVRRFLTGPRGCEITGLTGTPDGKTLFVNIQHPGETPSERANPNAPEAVSSWPHNQFPQTTGGRPRSATLVIQRKVGA